MNISILDNNSFLVVPGARLDAPDEKPILEACSPRSSASRSCIFLDFRKTELINGLGASLLVKLAVLAQKRGQKVIAGGVSSHYREVFKLTGLDAAMAVYPTLKEALVSEGLPITSLPLSESGSIQPLDLQFWAKPERLTVPVMPKSAINLNMNGRQVAGPVLGFGRLWQKRYGIYLSKPALTPESVIQVLKDKFPSFQPSYNHFYPTPAGFQPGAVIAIDSSTPGGPVSTGVMVMYSDPVSFTFITPQGHPESGWVTFSAAREEDKIVAQILGLARANDPVYEAAFRAIGSQMQIRIWTHVLRSLAQYLGEPSEPTVDPRLIDSGMRWSQTGNLWYNAQIRTILDTPFRWFRRGH